jgi:predicted transcriptional regulator
MPARHEPQVLRPYHRSEALSIAEAAKLAGRSVRTVESGVGVATSDAVSAANGL